MSVANVYYAQPLLDALAHDFNLAQAAVGGVITAAQIGSAVALIFLVPLGDRLPRRPLMLAQLAALVVALAGVSAAQSIVQLLIGMLLVGLLGTAMTQGLIAYAATAALASERGRVVGAAQGGVVMGLLLARVLAGGIADLASWRMVYATSAALMILLAVALWRCLRLQAPPAHGLRYPQLVVSMFTLLARDRVLQVRGVIAMLMFAAFSAFWSGMVLLLSAPPYGLSHTVIGAFGLVGAVGALGAVRAGSWADRGHAQTVSVAALLLLAASWLPLYFAAASLWALVIGVLVLDLAGQAIHVTNQSLILRSGSEAHSRLIGGYMLFYALGSGVGAMASTWAYAHGGWPAVCALGAGLSAVAGLFWALTKPLTQVDATATLTACNGVGRA
ncbi:MFS transporter [Alcaligenaceae bacterium A4P071]|nr:MFS transporter [Alcaligenaceae bacterium A4P071]